MSRQRTRPPEPLPGRDDHGSDRAWHAGCGCEECYRGQSERMKSYREYRGRHTDAGLRDAAATRAHLRALRRNGASFRSISEQTGLNSSYLSRLTNGRIRRVRFSTEETVLALSYARAGVDDMTYVPAAPSYDAITRAKSVGISMTEIARVTGITPRVVFEVKSRRKRGVRVKTQRALVEGIDRMMRERARAEPPTPG